MTGSSHESGHRSRLRELLDGVDRPTLLVDERRARDNIGLMADRARAAGVRFRPHFKTHQSAAVGEWFASAGVESIAVSSLGMASYFADAGWRDITLAFPANPRRIDELEDLARRTSLGTITDDENVARSLLDRLPQSASVWVEIDPGYGRTGVSWEEPQRVVELAGLIDSSGAPRLGGLLTHAGQTYRAASADEVRAICAETIAKMQHLADKIDRAIGKLPEISIGDTPSCCLAGDLSGADEIRPGNFVFFDLQQLSLGACEPDRIAAVAACPVAGVYPRRDEIAIHGGAVHLSKDTAPGGDRRVHGLLVHRAGDGWSAPDPAARVVSLSQEHGIVRIDAGVTGWSPGDVALVAPAHSCLTAEMFGSYLTTGGRRLERFDARR
ncbi:MAG: alanine racemase [Polyangia bacterium]